MPWLQRLCVYKIVEVIIKCIDVEHVDSMIGIVRVKKALGCLVALKQKRVLHEGSITVL